MRTVALISGGKDSCFNMMCCLREGHQLVALANLRPEPKDKDELDSYMYQTVGHHAIDLYADAIGLPLYTQTITGSSLSTGRDYKPQKGDEVEDLFSLLHRVKVKEDIEAVSVGAILSDYQRVRVENVCQRLGLVSLSFLWRRNQEDLLKEMIDCGIRAIIIKVAALGLTPDKHLGMEISEIYTHILNMKLKYGLNECGEGGEYETFVFDCPIFKKAIVIGETEKIIHSHDAFAPVGYLNLKKCKLEDKQWDEEISLQERVLQLPMFTSSKWIHKATCQDSGDQPEQKEKSMTDIVSSTDSTSGESYLSSHSNGTTFSVSGVRAVDSGGLDIAELTKAAMNEMIDCVTKLGHSHEDITSVSLYVRDLSCFAAINSVYKTYFDVNPPVRLCIQACLPLNVPLQLDCQGWSCQAGERRTMHVQGLSHWAPANIGPYSQATLAHRKLYMAGIVPLVPASLSVVEGGIHNQCAVALTHVKEVMRVMEPGLGLHSCPLVVCFVTDLDYVSVAQKALEKDAKNAEGGEYMSTEVQYCVVPALPKGCLVEWQVFAWILEDDVEDDFAICNAFLNINKNWTIKTLIQEIDCKRYRGLVSCHFKVECIKSIQSAKLEEYVVEDLVKALIQQYTLHVCSDAPPLVKVFFVSSAFDYDQLNKCFQRLSPAGKCVISLVPVLSFQSSTQVLAWCQ